MIHKFIESFEKVSASSPIILSSDIQKHFGPDGKTVYLRGRFLFIDSSMLEIALFVAESHNKLSIDKYRYHYSDKHGQMKFRYDNAPHHHEMPSFPHHKHTPNKVIPSKIPTIKDILNEISATIIKK